MLTPEEFKQQMQDFFSDGSDNDCESSHIQADKLMCSLLTELGYGEGIEIFKNADEWYA